MEATFKQPYIAEFVDALESSIRGKEAQNDNDEPLGDSDYLDSLVEVFS